jgi:imidazolonepropionase-like amidohydrolase
MAYGLTEEQAIQSVSANTCKIIGIDEEYGTLEVGKSATLFVSEGNALDMRTNQLTHALIRGQFMAVGNFQKDLYDKYQKKYKK